MFIRQRRQSTKNKKKKKRHSRIIISVNVSLDGRKQFIHDTLKVSDKERKVKAKTLSHTFYNDQQRKHKINCTVS